MMMKLRLMRWGAVLSSWLMASVYFSTALDGVLALLLLLLWLASGSIVNIKRSLQNNPVALWALLLLVDMIFACWYSTVNFETASSTLSKYFKLLLIIIICDFLRTDLDRKRMLKALVLASLITLFGSYGYKYGLFKSSRPEYFFKDRVDHSLFIAFFAYYCCHQWLDHKKFKWLYAALILLCFHNLFFVCSGRIGQILGPLLFVLFGLQRLNIKWFGFFSAACLAIAVFFMVSVGKESRLYQGVKEIKHYSQQQEASDISMYLRISYWQHALTIIKKAPLLGHGTGSFVAEYKKLATAKQDLKGGTPHNEFLMLTAQLGMLGLGIFLMFLYVQYRQSFELGANYRYFAQGVLLTTIFASLFNPSFISHVKGFWLLCLLTIPFSSLNKHA